MTDRFVLWDEDGNKLTHKMMLSHIRLFIDEMHPEPGRTFIVKSDVSGYKMTITDETTIDDWREFEYQCDMALD